jgi:hypothetical protein
MYYIRVGIPQRKKPFWESARRNEGDRKMDVECGTVNWINILSDGWFY